ncbi:hypothetical protein BOTNAR_0078g00300 [Botryotinia narcissicola]|uniref:Uncharacterized protein n=1 Tax=Botryotinia narcissicola TaxID=278944 RepID=A0A4Z1J8E9_9HELO|nr:hypothetical protein BOTNAR_0078g00300 [Botryotinia narcissicola]
MNQKTIKIITGVKNQDATLTLASTDACRIVAALVDLIEGQQSLTAVVINRLVQNVTIYTPIAHIEMADRALNSHPAEC